MNVSSTLKSHALEALLCLVVRRRLLLILCFARGFVVDARARITMKLLDELILQRLVDSRRPAW